LSDTLIEISDKPGKLLDNTSIELVNDIDTLNIDTASKQEDSAKDEEVIAEVTVPITTNIKDKITEDMDFDLSQTWGGDAIYKDALMPEPPMNMVIVNPVEVGGLNGLENAMIQNQGNTASSTEEHQSGNPTQPEDEHTSTLEVLNTLIEGLEDQYFTSIMNEVKQDKEKTMDENNVPAQDSPDLLAMAIDDEIGDDVFANLFDLSPLSTVNLEDIAIPVNNDSQPPMPPTNEEVTQSQDEPLSAPAPKRKGPGRPKKPRTPKPTKPRGRPQKPLSESTATLTDHHNYSNAGASTSDSSSNEDVVIQRYRRMRNLNNVASQRCRLKRKEKMQAAFDVVIQEENRNKDLMIQVKVLEEQVRALKARFIDRVANPVTVVTATVKAPTTSANPETAKTTTNRASSPTFDLNQFVEESARQFGY